MTEIREWLDSLETDLRKKIDRTDSLDDLFQISFSGTNDEKLKTSWCLAKMAQNKCEDMRIMTILMSLTTENEDIRENVLWGLGELAGTGIGDEDSFSLIKKSMYETSTSIRSMAVWSAGRYRHKLKIWDEESIKRIEELLDDDSPLVRSSAEYALNND